MINVLDENRLLPPHVTCMLRDAADVACRMEGKRGHVDIFAVSEEEMRAQNHSQRGIDSVTDVLSFPSAPVGETPADGFWGDILLCPARAAAQAESYGHSLEREFAFLVVHGMLHLFGYDHIRQEDDACMREKQKQILERIMLNNEADHT